MPAGRAHCSISRHLWQWSREGPLSGLGRLIWGEVGGVSLAIWSLGHRQDLFPKDGIPLCLQPPGGSRSLPKGGEKALLWPSLVIRLFNCNYFCN